MKKYLFASSAVLATVLGLVSGPTSWAKPSDLPSNNQIEYPDGSDDPVPKNFSIEVGLDLFTKRVNITVKTSADKTDARANIDTVCTSLVPVYLEHLLKLVSESLTPRSGAEPASKDKGVKPRTVEMRLFDPVNVRIQDVPLKQAIKHLAFASGVRIVADDRALREAKIDLNAPVSLVLEGASVHTALQQLLHAQKLTYVIENEIVKITTKEKGRGTPAERAAEAKNAHAQRLFEIGEIARRAGVYDQARACFQQVHLLTPTSAQGRMAIVRLIEIEERMRETAEEQNDPEPQDDPEQAYRDMRDRTVPLGLVEASY
jgi:hypothetical protein